MNSVYTFFDGFFMIIITCKEMMNFYIYSYNLCKRDHFSWQLDRIKVKPILFRNT